jgi:type I site-specific restriction-modification system R (restriction) subunit
MNAPNASTFIASKFVARSKYDKVFADRDALSEQLIEAMKALAECVERRNSAEGILKSLKFQRHANGVWVNTEL